LKINARQKTNRKTEERVTHGLMFSEEVAHVGTCSTTLSELCRAQQNSSLCSRGCCWRCQSSVWV